MNSSRPHLFGLVAGLFLSVGLCMATVIASRAWMKVTESQEISVTGSARKDVRSDLAIWHANFTTRAETLPDTHERSKSNLAEVEAFLKAAGQTQYVIKPVSVAETFETIKQANGTERRQRTGFSIMQSIEVRSEDVESLPKLASDAAKLIDKGIMLETAAIRFIYTKAGEAKIEMMGEASKDARTRAEQIATQGGRKLKGLRSARAGVVQINPRYSTSTSWEGNNDTDALEKTIITTVTATFGLD